MQIDTVGVCASYYIKSFDKANQMGTFNTIKATVPHLRVTKGAYIHVSATLHYRGSHPLCPNVLKVLNGQCLQRRRSRLTYLPRRLLSMLVSDARSQEDLYLHIPMASICCLGHRGRTICKLNLQASAAPDSDDASFRESAPMSLHPDPSAAQKDTTA